MSWDQFTRATLPKADTATDIVRLGTWTITPHQQDLVECRATVSYANRSMSLSATASGPVGAMTSILYEIGAPMQIMRSHQRNQDGRITARLLCESNYRQFWASGGGATCDEANVNALVAGANELLAGSYR